MNQGAFILGCAGPRLSPDEAAFFAEAQPLGFILFARNVRTPDQLRRLTGDLRAAVGRDAPILIDQEGGRVQRMGAPHWAQYLPPLDQVEASGTRAARGMFLRAQLIAMELRDVGIDVNCTPSADIARPKTHRFLRNRCYGKDSATVTRMARAVAAGNRAGGVLSVIKHIPGHGLAQVDSHHNLPRVFLEQDELMAQDFVPFRALNDLPFGMTAHVVLDRIDPDNPATQSPEVIRMIREEIGFQGFLMTDDISMNALAGWLGDRCGRAMAAGCDAVLHCNGKLMEMQRVADHCGALDAAGQARAEAALAQRCPPEKVDRQALEDELNSLVKGAVMHD